MKANELRIGNLIYQDSHISEVIALSDIGIVSEIIEKSAQTTNSARKAPIPINEDWLIRFGFEPEYEDFIFLDQETGIELEASWSSRLVSTGEKRGWHIVNYSHVKHVHELQNLYFALTGEELELNK